MQDLKKFFVFKKDGFDKSNPYISRLVGELLVLPID